MITLGEWTDQLNRVYEMPAYLALQAERERLKARLTEIIFPSNPSGGYVRVIDQDEEAQIRERLQTLRDEINHFLSVNTPPRPTC